MQKKLGWGLLVLLSGALTWYLCIKPNDYQVTFRAKAITGTINQAIKLWANDLSYTKLMHQADLQHSNHQLQFNDSVFAYEWNVAPLNDSTSQVKVRVTDIENSLSIEEQPVEFFYKNLNLGFEKLTGKVEVFMP